MTKQEQLKQAEDTLSFIKNAQEVTFVRHLVDGRRSDVRFFGEARNKLRDVAIQILTDEINHLKK